MFIRYNQIINHYAKLSNGNKKEYYNFCINIYFLNIFERLFESLILFPEKERMSLLLYLLWRLEIIIQNLQKKNQGEISKVEKDFDTALAQVCIFELENNHEKRKGKAGIFQANYAIIEN